MKPYKYISTSLLKRKYHFSTVLLQTSLKENADMRSWISNSNQSDPPVTSIISPDTISIDNSFDEKISSSRSIVAWGTHTKKAFVTPQRFQEYWTPKLTSHSILSNSISVHEIVHMEEKFTLNQIVHIAQALFQYKKIYEIHQIYRKYYDDLMRSLEPEQLNEMVKDTQKSRLLFIFMETEYLLGNFHTFEELFSIYIKYSSFINSRLVEMAFLSFINTSNFTMCKDFFQQIMANEEQYHLNENHFINILKKISLSGELELLHFFVETWVIKRFGNNYNIISTPLLRFIHSVYLEHENNESLSTATLMSVKKLHRMLKRDYLKSAQAKTVKYYTLLKAVEQKDIYTIEQLKILIDQLLHEQHVGKPENLKIPTFLTNVLHIATHRGLTEMFYWILQKCMQYKSEFTYLDYVKLEEIVADNLSHKHDLDGLIAFINNASHLKFNTKILQLLNQTFLNRYPFLKKAIYPEFKVVLSQSSIQQLYPWSNIFLCKHVFDNNVGNLIKKKLSSPAITNFDNSFFFDDLSIKEKLKNSYIILKKYSNNRSLFKHIDENQIDSVIEFLEKMFKEGHFRYTRELPMKFEILKLEIHLKRSLKKMTRSEKLQREYRKVVDSFIAAKDLELTSEDYLRLANFVTKRPFKDFNYGKRLLDKSLDNIRASTDGDSLLVSKNWYKFYMTSLRLAVQSHDIGLFVQLLKDWDQNKEAFFVLQDCVSDLKGFHKYWVKRRDILLEKNTYNSQFHDEQNKYDQLVEQIPDYILSIKQRYVDYEYDGLNKMQNIMECVKKRYAKDFAKQQEKRLLKESKD